MNTSINSIRVNNIVNAVRGGVRSCYRPEPLTLAQWADENFYLSSESSYLEGRWETLPFQTAILNAIGHDDIIYINLVKSARVGYSQMLRAMLGYFTEHKSRNLLLYQPTDAAAQGFMKAHVETMIRDVPVVRSLAPWLGKKHRDSTLDTKRFSNGKQLWVLGGTAAKNYREKSVDVVAYDELAAFDSDIEKEGDAVTLGDKRIEGSIFPKSVRGSTPKLSHNCQITKAANESDCYMRFHLPCPHCGAFQTLKFGGDGAEFGFKWVDGRPETAAHMCESCGALGVQSEWQSQQALGVWRCDNTNAWTKNGIDYYCQEGNRIDAPESIAFHIWTAYSPFTTWTRIVKDYLKAKPDVSRLKTFINTTLGETWDEDTGEKLEPELLFLRREHYPSQVPVNNCVLTAAVDTQDDRFEIEVVAWVAGEESYRISYERLYGDLSRSEIWNILAQKLNRTFVTPDGNQLDIQIACIDSGGHYSGEVYLFCRKHNVRKFIPIKGASESGKPVIRFPRKKTDERVYLTHIGTDTAKEVISSRLQIATPGEGYMHYPVSPEFDEEYFRQLTAERKKRKLVKGRWKSVWDAGGRRNEPFDTSVYNLAAIRILTGHRGVDLAKMIESEVDAEQKTEHPPIKKQVRRSRYRF